MDSIIYTDKMISNLKSILNQKNRSITFPKFVFLCGKCYDHNQHNSSNRGTIGRFLNSKSKDIIIVLSEEIWDYAFSSNIDLLTFEDFLAEISDWIILFVESAGSICELGAFAYVDSAFKDKLILVLDKARQNDKSFIMTGAVAKATKDKVKVIFTKLEGNGLLSNAEMRELVEQIASTSVDYNSKINVKSPNINKDKINVYSFILELLELIEITQPVLQKDLIEIYKEIKGFNSFKFVKRDGQEFHDEIKIEYIIRLLHVVKIIDINEKGLITLKKERNIQSFMFLDKTVNKMRERNKLLCRRYKIGEIYQ